MDLDLNKGTILGIAGGITVFIIILIFIIYNSDFDQNLINQVEEGVPADKLVPQIDIETEKMKSNAQKRYQSHILDTKEFEKKGDLASPSDYEDCKISYNVELGMISKYDEARKKYAKREITKEQFLLDIQISKEYFRLL